MENKIIVHTVSLEANQQNQVCIIIRGSVNDKVDISFSYLDSEQGLIDLIDNKEFVNHWVKEFRQYLV